MSDIIKKQIEVYQESFLKYGDTPQGTNQNDRETQNLRYHKLLRPFLEIHKGKFSLHDFGSGLSDLHKYLLDQNIEHEYSGTEIVPEMVEAVQKKYHGVKIYNRDILKDPVTDKHDLIIVCGTFCIPGGVPTDEWKKFTLDATVKLFDMCNGALSFSHMTTHKTKTMPNQFYMDPSEMLEFCAKNLSRFVVIDHAYPLYEYTVTVFKKDYMRSRYHSASYDKYFR